MHYISILYLVIILEGYVVLSAELLAIRQTIPFIGSGTDTVSIIIAAVLMPLAFGYQAGGRFKPTNFCGRYWSIRNKLIFNILLASLFLLIGLSYLIMHEFFSFMLTNVVSNRLILVSLYCCLFLVVPVYLLAQTIPLCSNYFSKERLAKTTGKILSVSTLGSFMGAVFSTVVLMGTIGVHHTVTLIFLILFTLVFMLSKKKISDQTFISFAILCCSIYLNSGTQLSNNFNIVKNNEYNTISVYNDAANGDRHLSLNGNDSSKYNNNGRKHDYIEFIERLIIDPEDRSLERKDVLVIGAGAFTLGYGDHLNDYDYVDIDKSLKNIAETHILKNKLQENQIFYPMPARAYLAKPGKNYDFIVLDAYFGDLTIPEQLVTQDFFKQVKNRLNPNGSVIANFIVSPNFKTQFSRNIDNTIRSVFPHVSRHVIYDLYKPSNRDENFIANIIYIYSNTDEEDSRTIYTDNKNTFIYDKPKNR